MPGVAASVVFIIIDEIVDPVVMGEAEYAIGWSIIRRGGSAGALVLVASTTLLCFCVFCAEEVLSMCEVEALLFPCDLRNMFAERNCCNKTMGL